MNFQTESHNTARQRSDNWCNNWPYLSPNHYSPYMSTQNETQILGSQSRSLYNMQASTQGFSNYFDQFNNSCQQISWDSQLPFIDQHTSNSSTSAAYFNTNHKYNIDNGAANMGDPLFNIRQLGPSHCDQSQKFEGCRGYHTPLPFQVTNSEGT